MERNREARRGTLAAVNGLSRRRQRSSYRESLDEDGGMEMQEMGRLRDRGSKKDRARDRSGRSKRRRVDRHASNRDEAENSSEDSNNEDDEDEDALEASVPVRLPPPPIPLPPLNSGSAASVSHNHHRKSFPMTAKAGRSAAAWKPADEMIGVPVPRKARSSSAKRSHEFSGSGGGGEPIHASPARPSPPSSTQLLPSSSSASARKKMKPISGNGGSKHRPEKVNKSPSVSEDLEIEVAEVLFGLTRQFQSPPKLETHKLDSKVTNGSSNEANGWSNEANSRVSSPISFSPQPAEPQPPVLAPSNPNSHAAPTAAPKRTRPRLARLEGDNLAVPSTSASSSAAKMDSSQSAKLEASSSRSEKMADFTVENGTDQNDLGVSQVGTVAVDFPQDSAKLQNNSAPELKISLGGSDSQDRDETKQKASSPSMKECPPLSLNVNIDKPSVVKTVPADENSRKTPKFSFDLMVPPLGKSSSDREGLSDYSSTDHKAKDTAIQMAPKGEIVKAEEVKKVKSLAMMEAEEVKLEARTTNSPATTEVDLKKISEERTMDLQLDFDKQEKDNVACNKQHVRKQPKVAKMEHEPDKAEQSAPLSVAGWPGKAGSFPPFGYMAQVPPLQGVVPGDGTTVCSKPIQRPNFLSSDNRPKRCATHGYIAHNIYYHQQLSRMNPGRHAATGAPPLYGPKLPDISAANHYNLNAAPPSESLILRSSLPGNIASNLVPIPEKAGQLAATYPSHSIKEKSSAGNAFAEAALRNQLALQQAPQPGSVGNMLHGPAFIFSMNQPQVAAAAAAAAHFGSSKPIPGTGNAATSSNAASSIMGSSGVSGPTMSFNFPVMPTNEAHYMSLLQNSGYPFPIPAHAGAHAVYNGGCTVQPVPFFNGPFYSSQMLPPQLQQHQQQQTSTQQPSNSHAKKGHQSTSTSSGSSSSQKAPQQSQRAPGGGPTGTLGTTQGLSASKQQRPQLLPQCETGTESPSTADSRVLQAQKNIYGPNPAMAIHPQNYAFITAAAAVAASALGSGSGTHNEKQQATSQHQSMKVDLTASQAFAFASAAAAATVPPGMDFSSMAQNHAFFQSLPEAAKHGYHISAAASAQASQHRKQHHHIAEDGKSTGDSTSASTGVEERKTITWAKSLGNVPQHPVNFSGSDNNPPNPTIPGNSVINSSSRTLNLIQAPPANGGRLSNRPASAAPAATCNAPTAPAPPNSQQQQHQQLIQLHTHQQQQQQQMLQMQHQFANRSAKSSTSTNNSTAIYSDQLPAGSTMSKFPQALAGFPQSFLQSSGTTQSPQWKASNRATTPAPPSPAASSSKNQVAQQQGRSTQQSPLMPGHQTQISFGAGSSLKAAGAAGPQHLSGASSNPPLSAVAAMAPGSPQSPVGKTSGGSPRASSSSKPGATHSHAAVSPLQQQQQSGKNSPSSRSSPLSSSNAPSILGHPPMTTAMNASAKQQQQFPQALFFSNAYLQAQTSQSNGGPPCAMYYHQRRPWEQQSQQVQQNSYSGGPTPADPVKAAAAAGTSSSMKAAAGMLQHPTQFGTPAHPSSIPFISAASGFPYIHGMQSPSTTTKGSEQKPTGNDNLHASWQPEKK